MLRLRKTRPGALTRRNGSRPWWLLLVVLSSGTAALAADARPSASRLVPAAGLAFYVEYEGVDAHADAWKATAAYRMLHETTAATVVTRVAEGALGELLRNVPGTTLTGSDLVSLHAHVVHHGFALARYDEAGATSTVLILDDLGGQEARARFERLLRFSLQMEPAAAFPGPRQFRGRAVLEASTTPLSWWWEGDTLIVVRGPAAGAAHQARVAAVLDTIEARRPSAATHAALRAAFAEGDDIAGFEPNGVFFAESREGPGVLAGLRDAMTSPPPLDSVNEFDLLDALGVSRSERIVGRWGFRGKALLTDVRFAASGPWKGFIGMLRPSGFRRDQLPPIPLGMGAMAVGSLGGGTIGEVIAPIRKGITPDALRAIEAVEELMHDDALRRAAEDVRRHMGPTWCVYAAPGGAGSATSSSVPTAVIEIDDADAVDRALGALASRFNGYLREQEQGSGDALPAALVLERLPAPDRGYRLSSPAQAVPWLRDVQPTVVLGKSHLAIAANLALGRAAIAAESNPGARWSPTGELARSLEGLPGNPAMLIVGDPRDSSWPEAIANLPRAGIPFVLRFFGAPVDDEAEPPPRLLGLLGVERPRVLRGLPEAPTTDAVRAFLFPSVTAATVDATSFRLIRVEALPFACLGLEAGYAPGGGPRPLSIGIRSESAGRGR